MKSQIVVTSSSHLPRFTAGVSFTGAKAFPLDRFNADQLHELLADRLLTVVIGRVLTPADVDGFCAATAEEAEYNARTAPFEPVPADDLDAAETVPGATSEVVSGLAVYPAGSQAAVLPAAGEVVVDAATAGGIVSGAASAAAETVVVHPHHGRGRRGA